VAHRPPALMRVDATRRTCEDAGMRGDPMISSKSQLEMLLAFCDPLCALAVVCESTTWPLPIAVVVRAGDFNLSLERTVERTRDQQRARSRASRTRPASCSARLAWTCTAVARHRRLLSRVSRETSRARSRTSRIRRACRRRRDAEPQPASRRSDVGRRATTGPRSTRWRERWSIRSSPTRSERSTRSRTACRTRATTRSGPSVARPAWPASRR
jgi:hypothetical protein